MVPAIERLATALWHDDDGAVLSVEYVLVSGVLVASLVSARNSINAAYANMGNTVTAAVSQPTFSGFSVGGPGGTAIASVPGLSVPAPTSYLQASQVAPVPIPSP